MPVAYIPCRLHRLNSDITQNYSVTKRLKADKDRLERECAQEQEKHRQTHGKVKMLSAKLKTEKEEVSVNSSPHNLEFR